MLSLPDLQRELAHGLLAPASTALLASIEPDGLSAADRVQIYANHFQLSLAAALGDTFPVVRQLVGGACFTQLAKSFVCACPPRSPCLFEYGADLPRFLTAQQELGTVPYTADVARLEWAMNEARHAPEAAITGGWPDPERLGEPERLAFAVDASVRFVESRWPVDQIWRANRPDADPTQMIELEARGCRLVIHRDGDGDLAWLPLPEAEFTFIRALAVGHTLARAGAMACAIDPALAPVPLLKALIGAGIITDAIVLLTPERSLP
jgi:hypothetical protein